MKLSKLMLSACVAALALVACNKENPQEFPANNNLKSVEISLENVIFTKADGGDRIVDGQSVNLKNFKIFFTDGLTFFPVYDENHQPIASTYYTALPAQNTALSFHFIDPKVTNVVIVANMGDVNYADMNVLKAATLDINKQQDQKELALYGNEPLAATNRVHEYYEDDGSAAQTTVYEAKVKLAPRIARIEIDGFHCYFTPESPNYNEINITQIAFNDYYSGTYLWNGTETGNVMNVNDASQPDIFDYFAANAALNPVPWYADVLDVTLTPTAPTVEGLNIAYSFFPSASTQTVYPQLFIQLTADDHVGYLVTKSLKDNATQSTITEFKEGYIYRMRVSDIDGDGTPDEVLPFDEEDIQTLDRCIEVFVEVVQWTVNYITPEF